ncbi:MAG: ribose-5-phosphate isomerase [Streptosporangiales bacterium]|nr:ribose-5-phosphate isomerase [Streptosporangiales bacterium]
MHVYIGSDHAGYELKTQLAEWLKEHGHDVVDCGPEKFDPEDDYPPFCIRVGESVVVHPGSLGVVIGGSGNGEQIAANKVRGVRAALAWSPETASLAREHNDANVLALGARMHDTEEAFGLVDRFLATPYSGEQRHTRRIKILAEYERTGQAPPLP